MTDMNHIDLTDVVEQVAATVWAQQRPNGPAWDHLTAVEQHNCREAVLPFVAATRDALTPHVAAMLDQVRAEAWEVGVRHGEACDGGMTCPGDSANPYRIGGALGHE